MSWVRNKALTTELSPAPSLTRWLLAGALMAITGVLLFMLHVSGAVNALSALDIWWVSLALPGGWLLVFCLRCYLWDREVKEYQFLQKEAQYGQRQWDAWAERHLVILGSSVLLPDGVTANVIQTSSGGGSSQQYALARRIVEIPQDNQAVMKRCLGGVQTSLRQLPPDLPLRVTLLSDARFDGIAEHFAAAWHELLPDHPVPDDITVTDSFSFAKVEERIKQPVLTVDLILVMQLNGGKAYSDGLAALLLTSDDVAQKYQLCHSSRLLRPMPLDMAKFDDDLTLFLETQTVACRTPRVSPSPENRVSPPLFIRWGEEIIPTLPLAAASLVVVAAFHHRTAALAGEAHRAVGRVVDYCPNASKQSSLICHGGHDEQAALYAGFWYVSGAAGHYEWRMGA